MADWTHARQVFLASLGWKDASGSSTSVACVVWKTGWSWRSKVNVRSWTLVLVHKMSILLKLLCVIKCAAVYRGEKPNEHSVWNMPRWSVLIIICASTEARPLHPLVAWQQCCNLSQKKILLCWTLWIFPSVCSGLIFVDANSSVAPLSSSSLNIWNNYP